MKLRGLVIAAGLLVPCIVHASPSAKLVYVRGADTDACPGEPELRKAVAARLGYDPFFPVAHKTVVAQVTRATKGYRARVQIVGEDGKVRGERELSTKGEDCNELVGAIALAVSVALDDIDDPPSPPPSEPPPPPPPPQPEPPVAPPAPADKPREAPPAATPRTPIRIALALGPTVSFGTAPASAAGAALSGSLRFSSFAFRLDVRGDLPASSALTPSGTVSTTGFTAVASFCLRAKVPYLCAGGGSGLLASRTDGLERNASDSAPLGLAVLKLGANAAIGDVFFLEPFVDLGANLVQHRVQIDRGRTVYEMPPIWLSAGILAGVSFL